MFRTLKVNQIFDMLDYSTKLIPLINRVQPNIWLKWIEWAIIARICDSSGAEETDKKWSVKVHECETFPMAQ